MVDIEGGDPSPQKNKGAHFKGFLVLFVLVVLIIGYVYRSHIVDFFSNLKFSTPSPETTPVSEMTLIPQETLAQASTSPAPPLTISSPLKSPSSLKSAQGVLPIVRQTQVPEVKVLAVPTYVPEPVKLEPFKGENAIDEILRLIIDLRSPDWQTRKGAADTLAELGSKAKFSLLDLNQTLKDKKEIVRVAGCRAISVIGPVRGNKDPLKAALKDENLDVRYFAEKALKKLKQIEKREGL